MVVVITWTNARGLACGPQSHAGTTAVQGSPATLPAIRPISDQIPVGRSGIPSEVRESVHRPLSVPW